MPVHQWKDAVIRFKDDEPICLCPDADTAVRIGRLLEHEDDFQKLIDLCRSIRESYGAPAWGANLYLALKPFEKD